MARRQFYPELHGPDAGFVYVAGDRSDKRLYVEGGFMQEGPDGNMVSSGPVFLTADQIASPTAAILADTGATYIGPHSERLASNGTALLSLGSTISYKAGGTSAAYVSSFDGALINGAFGLPVPISIQGNLIQPGSTQIEITLQVSKVGTGTAFGQIHFGPLNSTADTNILSGGAPQFTAVNPGEWQLRVLVNFSAGRCNARWMNVAQSVGLSGGFPTEQAGLNFAVTNYINFVISGAAAGTTYNLLGYSVSVFK